MPMLTAASDAFDRRSTEYHELPAHLQSLSEAAFTLRGGWEMLDACETASRREGRHDDAHDARTAEQTAYNAWQAVELAYRLIAARIGDTAPDTMTMYFSVSHAPGRPLPYGVNRRDADTTEWRPVMSGYSGEPLAFFSQGEAEQWIEFHSAPPDHVYDPSH